MASHHKGSKNYTTLDKHATAEQYAAFYDRIEAEFDVEDLTPGRISEWLGSHTFSDTIARSRQIYLIAQRSQDLDELNDLKHQTSDLVVYKDKIIDLIDSRILEIQTKIKEDKIAKSIARTQEFAKKRNINLSNKVLGNIETWKDKITRIVIRERGRLRAWTRE